jgi:hypothetical protein
LNFLISKNSAGLTEEKENKIKEISTQFEIIRDQIDLERRKRFIYMHIKIYNNIIILRFLIYQNLFLKIIVFIFVFHLLNHCFIEKRVL